MTIPHVPVLAGELIELLDPRPGETVVDATFGAGGHARLVADRLGPEGTLVAIDRDPAAEERFDAFAGEAPCSSRFLSLDYADGLALLVDEQVTADIVYLDLGLSSMQVDEPDRGFSYAHDAPLDMRMDPRQDLDARTILNEWDERRLTRLFRELGEERYARQIAGTIVARRPLERTFDLVDAITSAIPTPARFAGGHPARRVFQAVRIAVNDELSSLDRALPEAWRCLRDGGRLGAIAFHSLEDRRVKRFLADLARGCVCPPELPACVCDQTPRAELLSRGGVVPTPGEVAHNPRARSGRLRAARKLGEPGDRAL
jgi:16S rRNA (cytosine1402-N4)-methyltransferase